MNRIPWTFYVPWNVKCDVDLPILAHFANDYSILGDEKSLFVSVEKFQYPLKLKELVWL